MSIEHLKRLLNPLRIKPAKYVREETEYDYIALRMGTTRISLDNIERIRVRAYENKFAVNFELYGHIILKHASLFDSRAQAREFVRTMFDDALKQLDLTVAKKKATNESLRCYVEAMNEAKAMKRKRMY